MKRLGVTCLKSGLTMAAASLFVTSAGCSVFHRHDNQNISAEAGAYSQLYIAAIDTEWVSDPRAANPVRGEVRPDAKLYFDRPPDLDALWQRARLEDNTIRYVHPADVRKGS